VSGVRPGGLEDRYVAPLEANRRGAHRARPNPLLGMLPLVAVAAVVIAVAGGIITLVGGDGLLPSKGGNTVAGSTIAATKTARPSTTPSATARTPAKSAKPSSTRSSSASQTQTAPVGTVSKGTKITVYNATTPAVKGLAKTVSDTLGNAGWSTTSYVFTSVPKLDQTIIYYASSDLEATANAVKDALGVGQVKLSSRLARSNGGIGVHVGNDYQK
jgi:LytR cell envelope-related transcriptional attenuator